MCTLKVQFCFCTDIGVVVNRLCPPVVNVDLAVWSKLWLNSKRSLVVEIFSLRMSTFFHTRVKTSKDHLQFSKSSLHFDVVFLILTANRSC